ncbi:MAG: hypothetical protein RL481_1040 [Pseudomonadota bacterium]|jgi:DNA-binding HxlR family transcriptional regulator
MQNPEAAPLACPVSRLEKWTQHQLSVDACPVRLILAPTLGKWTLLLLVMIEDAPRRFGELSRLIPDISRRMLSLSLRELEANGFIARRTLPLRPPGVEYSITSLGASLMTALSPALDWADKYGPDIMAKRADIGKNLD